MSKKINVLGTPYEIIVRKYEEDEVFERRSIVGYCDSYLKKIVICDMNTYKGWEHEEEATIAECQKANLRHEIVHAFFNESGLEASSAAYNGAWAVNEEMVDWLALQGPKIYRTWQEAEAI